MYPRIRFVHALVLQAVLLNCLGAASAQDNSIRVIRIPETGWSTHRGDDPHCAAVNDPACVWQSPGVPISGDTVDYWARIDLTLPPTLRTPQQLGLLSQGARPVYEVFVNGHRIGGSGSFKTRRGPNDTRAVFAFPSTLAVDGHLVIAVHLFNVRTGNEVGAEVFMPAVGPLEQILVAYDFDTFAYLRADWQHYLSFLAVFCVGVFFLVLYAMDRGAREHLYFALILGGISSLRLGELSSVVDLGFDSTFAVLLYACCNVVAFIASIEFPFALLRRRVPRFFRVIQCFYLLYLVHLFVLLPLPVTAIYFIVVSYSNLLQMLHIVIILGMVAWLLVLPACFKSPLKEMRWIGGAMTFLVFEDINRQLTQAGLPGFPQEVQLGSLTFDIRAAAYLLFAVVMLIAMTVRFRRVQRRNQAIEQELAAAAAVQSLLLSSAYASTQAFAIETAYLPAGEVGGDFFHVMPGNAREADGELLVVIGDVSGKGLRAAMTVAAIIGALRDYTDRRPVAVLEHLNRVLYGQTSGLVTCCCARLSADGKLILANAGHPAPYLNGVEIETGGGLPLGLVAQFGWTEHTIGLDKGDRLTFVTDGVVEASKPSSGELFGFERTQKISTQTAESIAAAAKAFGAGAPQADDITVLTITRAAVA
jgi:hypothetical protein